MAGRKISNVSEQERSAAEAAMTEIFSQFAEGDTLSEAGLKRFAAEADTGVDEAQVGLIFQAVKVGRKPGLNFERFKEAVRKIAMEKESTYHELVQGASMKLNAIADGADGEGGTGDDDESNGLTDAQLAAYASAFKSVDKDQSGAVDSAELGTILKSLGEDASEDACTKMLAELDIDGDGQVSFDEFVLMMAKRNGKSVNSAAKAKIAAAKRLSQVAGIATGAVLHSGWMEKRSTTGTFKNWKKRWFQLRTDRLQYFATEADAEAGKMKGEVVFVDGMVVEERGADVEPKRAGCFVMTGSVDLYCVVADDGERTEWMKKIVQAYDEWQVAITETLALLVGPDPALAAAAMMNQGADYMNYRQNSDGVSLSPFYVQMGRPVPIKFVWDWDTKDVDGVLWKKRGIKSLVGGDPWERVAIADGVGKVTLKPGAGYSFRWLKGEDGWLSPMQEEPSLLYKLKRVPLLGAVLDALPESMQKKIENLPEGKVRDLLEKIGALMPLNTFDVAAGVRCDYGIFSAETPVLTGGQKILQLKDVKLNDPQTRFAIRIGLLTAAITAIAKSFELVGLAFLAVWIKESVNDLFLPAQEATEAGIMKMAAKKAQDGSQEYGDMTACWEGERQFYENELNEQHMEFLGGLRVKLPSAEDVLRAARSRQPQVDDGATVPVLFQWAGEAEKVEAKYCEVSEKFNAREKAEKDALQEAKSKWKAEQTAILKKKLGFEKAAEGEDLTMTTFKYEKPARETIVKEWQTVTLERTPGVGDGPVDPHKKRMAKANFFCDKPLPAGDYCFKFVVDGSAYYQEGKPIPEDSDAEYRMMHVQIQTSFGLGFDVGV